MKLALFIISTAASIAVSAPGAAQSAGVGQPQTQPFGTTFSESARPYQAAARDENGNRIVINGRQIGAGSGLINPAHSHTSLASRGGTTLARGGTLGQAGTTAASIGNSVSISGTVASTIIINQTNNSSQTVNVNGAPQARGR